MKQERRNMELCTYIDILQQTIVYASTFGLYEVEISTLQAKLNATTPTTTLTIPLITKRRILRRVMSIYRILILRDI